MAALSDFLDDDDTAVYVSTLLPPSARFCIGPAMHS